MLPPAKLAPSIPRKDKKKSVKRARVPSSEEESKEDHVPLKIRKVSTWLASTGDYSLSYQSISNKEGELSEDEG